MRASSTVLKSVAVRALLLWLPLQLSVGETIVDHPPVLEGSSLTLVCSGKTSSSSRDLIWRFRTLDGEDIDAALCQFKQQRCVSYVFSAEMLNKEKSFESYLTISNITLENRIRAVYCAFYDGDDLVANKLSWNLSNIFVRPESPQCDVTLSEDGTEVNISCNTTRVYPQLTCQVNNPWDSPDPVVVSTTKQLSRNQASYSATCSFLLPVKIPGSYSFPVQMFPGLRRIQSFSMIANVSTSEISIPSQPIVRIQPNSVYDCHKAEAYITCSAYWMPEKPTFTWHIDSERNGNFSPIVKEETYTSGNSSYKVYVARHTFTNATSYAGERKVECVIKYKDGNSTNEINDTKTLQVIVAPPSPVFKNENGLIITEGKIELSESREVMVTCEVEGGIPRASSVEIECKNLSESIRFQASSTKVTAPIADIDNSEWNCTCFARHLAKCYNSFATLTIYPPPRRSTSEDGSKDKQKIALVILMAASALTFLLLIIMCVFFVRKRRGFRLCLLMVNRRKRSSRDSSDNTRPNNPFIAEPEQHDIHTRSLANSLRTRTDHNDSHDVLLPIQMSTLLPEEDISIIQLKKQHDNEYFPENIAEFYGNYPEGSPPRPPPRNRMFISEDNTIWNLARESDNPSSSHSSHDGRSLPKPCRGITHRIKIDEFIGSLSDPLKEVPHRRKHGLSQSAFAGSLKRNRSSTSSSSRSEKFLGDGCQVTPPEVPPREPLLPPDILENL